MFFLRVDHSGAAHADRSKQDLKPQHLVRASVPGPYLWGAHGTLKSLFVTGYFTKKSFYFLYLASLCNKPSILVTAQEGRNVEDVVFDRGGRIPRLGRPQIGVAEDVEGLHFYVLNKSKAAERILDALQFAHES